MLRTILPAVVALATLLSGCGLAPQTALSATGAEVSSVENPGDHVSLPPLPPVRHERTLPTLMRTPDNGSDLRRERVLETNDAYTSYQVSYRSEDLRVSGVLHVPHGADRSPAVVIARGYKSPKSYRPGGSMIDTRDYLARAGYVVLYTDYRNHGRSDADPENDGELRLGFTIDVINAIVALRRSAMRAVDPDRIGLVGRSMGGGVAYNVLTTRPGLVDAAVLLSPMSADAVDNVEILTRPGKGRASRFAAVERSYGTPDPESPAWQDLSASRFFDRVVEPVLIHHGTADKTCPPEWTERAAAGLRDAGADVSVRWYDGAGHTVRGEKRDEMMRRTVRFLDARL
ncbi:MULTISPECIES: alpha/beta hydrolase family protein [Mumia]|uniref:alpha/beta hydrolase family protein n=1 Tax=Mumia TaxID=1546255 RepID=UPI0014215DCC|nr:MULTISPECIES: alpha/beta fold hydrolase [unclassified Mumia]QMW67299.1 alpha/beta fold hydrolase [Mumia sp. ZJ1417]